MTTRRNVAASITYARLLLNDTDPENDPISFVSAAPTSAQGGTITFGSGLVTYNPPPGFTGSDSFAYTITDGSSNVQGTVNVTVVPGDNTSLQTFSVTAAIGGSTTVIFGGVPGYSYQIQYADSMMGPWLNAGAPVAADGNGRTIFSEPTPGNQRFYRAVLP